CVFRAHLSKSRTILVGLFNPHQKQDFDFRRFAAKHRRLRLYAQYPLRQCNAGRCSASTRRSTAMKKLNVAAIILGMGALAGIVWKIGPAAITSELRHVWLGFALLLLLSLIRLLLRTLSWLISLSANRLGHSIWDLIGIRTASQSLGYLSALGPFLSEPLKIRLLGSSTQSATSTLADTGLYWFTSALFGIVGSFACGLVLVHKCRVIWVGLFSIIMLCGLVLLAKEKPLLTSAIELLGSRSPGWLTKGATIEGEIRRFRFIRPQAVQRMFWIDLICQVLRAGEVAVMLWAFGLHIRLLTVLSIETCTRAVNI